MKKLGFFGTVLFWVNSLAVFLLFLAFFLPYVAPSKSPTLSVLSLGVSPLLWLNFLFLVYWLLRRKRVFLLSASALVIAYFIFNPFYKFSSVEELLLPSGCSLIGIELTNDAIELPSFHHPRCAAYILGPERGILSDQMLDCCDYVVKIPMRFSINVGLAGALVMYDRMLSMGRFASRSQRPGGPIDRKPVPVFGQPAWVRKNRSKNR